MSPKQFHDLALSFPETEEGTSYGQPSCKAFGKFFTRLRAEDASCVVGCVGFDEREMLCAAEPETFHFTDHYRGYPYVLVRIAKITPARLKPYLERQWRKNAPAKWIRAWEAGEVLPELKALPPKRGARPGAKRAAKSRGAGR